VGQAREEGENVNIAGPVARGIFALTVVTILGAIASYALFKARDRKRRANRIGADEPPLTFFVEHRAAPIAPAVKSGERFWAAVTARLATALLLLGGTAAGVVFVLGRDSGLVSATKGRSANAPSTRAIRSVGHFVSRAPSLFPAAELDLDRDGHIDAKESALVHMFPQFVFVTSDDNGSVEGLRWIQDHMRARGMAAAVTYFNTANYLPSRPNYLGGPIDQLWQVQVNEAYLGIHGTTHKSGGEHWAEDQWRVEHGTSLDEVVHRLTPPPGTSWERYPFGSRAPFLSVDDAYYSALDKLAPAIAYDSSMVSMPVGDERVNVMTEARQLTWPFTLDHPLPPDVQIRPDSTQKLSSHHLWEVPLPAWRLPGGETTWISSLDADLFNQYPCDDVVDKAAVEAVLANLDAHYRGNRSPFHLGLHAQTYGAGSACQRATIAAIFDGIDKRRADGQDIQLTSIPDLLSWMDQKARPQDEANK
jgi:hypothetical protein